MTVVTVGDEQPDSGQQGSPKPQDVPEVTPDDAAQALGMEAARLAEAFTAWAGNRPTGSTEDRAATDGRDAAQTGAGPEEEPGESGDVPKATTCECGHTASTAAVCSVCPICRAATYVQNLRPEVLERVGDVLAMVAGSLQAMAAERSRERAAGPGQSGTAGSRSREADDEENDAAAQPAPSVIPIHVHGDEFPPQTQDAQ